jgi:hypothetical protein
MNVVDLGPEERSVLAAVRSALDPTEIQRARVRKALDAKLAAGVAAPLLVTSTALATMLKASVGVAMVAAIGTGLVYVADPQLLHRTSATGSRTTVRPAASQKAAAAPQPPMTAEPPPSAGLEPAPARSDARPTRPRVVVRRYDTTPAATSDLGGELDLLSQVSAATKQGEVARADALLRTYDQRYPAGQLKEERAAAGILVHCAAGRPQAARAEARQFLKRWPRSPLVVRIQSSCAKGE